MLDIYIPKIPDQSFLPQIREFKLYLPIPIQNTVENMIRSFKDVPQYIANINHFLRQINSLRYQKAILSKPYVSENIHGFILNFIDSQKRTISKRVIVPPYNMAHFGTNCYINVCFNILISIAKVFVPFYESVPTDPKFEVVRHIIAEIFYNVSSINIDPGNMEMIIKMLNFNISRLGDANEAFKTLMKELYKILSLSDILYWDSADTFISSEDKKLSFDELVDKYNPKYLIVNAQDYNIITNIPNNMEVKIFHKTPNHKFIIHGCIINMPSHFVSVFQRQNTWVLRNDIDHRCAMPEYQMRTNRFPIALTVFVNEMTV